MHVHTKSDQQEQPMNRRSFLTNLALGLNGALILSTDAEAALIRRRRRIRRRIRRRMRRRVVIRTVLGRPFWVVPVGLAVGWELMHNNRVVVVKETRIIERDGAKVEVAVVQDSNGSTEQIDVLREDTADNRKNLPGSVLPDDDKTTPGVDDEIEEEVSE
jgi:high-affinity K+ transport system ATPase subunit B